MEKINWLGTKRKENELDSHNIIKHAAQSTTHSTLSGVSIL